jgi:hypothetical protein
MGDEVLEIELGENGDATAGDGAGGRAGGVRGEGDEGDAHPEGVAGSGAAGVGEGVEGDVDLLIELEVLRERQEGGEDAAVGEVFGSEEVFDALAVDAREGMEEQAGVGELPENLRPGFQSGGRDFEEVVEAAEGDGAGCEGWWGGDG